MAGVKAWAQLPVVVATIAALAAIGWLGFVRWHVLLDVAAPTIFFNDQGAGHAAASNAVRFREGYIVVDQDGGVRYFEHFGGDFEIHYIACIILYDK